MSAACMLVRELELFLLAMGREADGSRSWRSRSRPRRPWRRWACPPSWRGKGHRREVRTDHRRSPIRRESAVRPHQGEALATDHAARRSIARADVIIGIDRRDPEHGALFFGRVVLGGSRGPARNRTCTSWRSGWTRSGHIEALVGRSDQRFVLVSRSGARGDEADWIDPSTDRRGPPRSSRYSFRQRSGWVKVRRTSFQRGACHALRIGDHVINTDYIVRISRNFHDRTVAGRTLANQEALTVILRDGEYVTFFGDERIVLERVAQERAQDPRFARYPEGGRQAVPRHLAGPFRGTRPAWGGNPSPTDAGGQAPRSGRS